MTFDSIINQATTAGKAQRARARRAGTAKVTEIVASVLRENNEAEQADIVRAVLAQTDGDIAGVDAMTDEELLRVVITGQRAMAVARALRKGGAQ